jgi:uncharacterized lipoprotein YmbA
MTFSFDLRQAETNAPGVFTNKEQRAAPVCWMEARRAISDYSNKDARELLLLFENRRLGLTENGLMRNPKLILAVGLATGLASLAGCAGKIRYPSYYVLNVPAPASANDRSKPILGSVAVREFTAPEFLREGPIAYRQSPEQLDFYNYHRWVEDPRRAVTAAMAQEMQARGLFRSVGVFDGRGSPEYLVTGTLDHLEEVDQGANVSVEVGVSARLIKLGTGEVLWQDRSAETAKLDERSVLGVVAGMSRELKRAVERLVMSMQDRVKAASASTSLGRPNTER